MVLNWLAGKQNKKIKHLQKVIDKLNDALESLADSEKAVLSMAASLRADGILAKSREVHEGDLEDIVLSYQQRTAKCEEWAKEFADLKRPVLDELVLIERLKKREIEALQDGAITKRQRSLMLICFDSFSV